MKSPNERETVIYFIDGTNLCYWLDTTSPTLRVLLELVAALKKEKNRSFYCIFDANTQYKLPQEEREIYQHLLDFKEYFYQVTGGKRADDFILELANSYDAPVISNDNYSDPKYAKYTWKERDFQPKRLFMGEVIPVRNDTHLILSELDLHVMIGESVQSSYRKAMRAVSGNVSKYKGRVKFYNQQEGWGLLVYDQDIYFQRSALLENIEEGSEVEFAIAGNEKGTFADQIILYASRKEKQNFQTGTIETYDEQKTMGTIKADTGEILFFYKSYFEGNYNAVLGKGVRVEFIMATNKNGPCARHINIIPVDETKPLKDRIAFLEAQAQEKDRHITEWKQRYSSIEGRLRSSESKLANIEKGLKDQQKQPQPLQDNALHPVAANGNGKVQPQPDKDKQSNNANNNNNNDKHRQNGKTDDQNGNNNSKPQLSLPQEESGADKKMPLPVVLEDNVAAAQTDKNKKDNSGKQQQEQQQQQPAKKQTAKEKQAPANKNGNKEQQQQQPKAEKQLVLPKPEKGQVQKNLQETAGTEPVVVADAVVENEAAKATVESKDTAVAGDKQTKANEDSKKQSIASSKEPVSVKTEKQEKTTGNKQDSGKKKPAEPVAGGKKENRRQQQEPAKTEKKNSPDVSSVTINTSVNERAKPLLVTDTVPPTAADLAAKEKNEETAVLQSKPSLSKEEPKLSDMPEASNNANNNESVGNTPPPSVKSTNNLNAEAFDTSIKRRQWWLSLQPQWKKAFNFTLGRGEITDVPDDEGLVKLFMLNKLNYSKTAKNKLSFALTNLSGLQFLTNLQQLTVSEQTISELKGLEKLHKLTHLNLNKNNLSSLDGIEQITTIEEFHCSGNQLSIAHLATIKQYLPKLRLLDCRQNKLADADKKQLKELKIAELKA